MTRTLTSAEAVIAQSADLDELGRAAAYREAANDHMARANELMSEHTDPRASERRQIDYHVRQAEALSATDGARIDYSQVLNVSGDPDDGPTDRSGLHRTADQAVERLNRRGLLTDGAAQTMTGLMERGHAGDREMCQRYAAAACDPHYVSAFGKYVLDSQNVGAALTPEEGRAYRAAQSVRAWVEGTPASAGWLVPASLDLSLQFSNASQISPILQVARTEVITGDRWRGLTTAGTTAVWRAELDPAVPTTPTIAVPEVPVHFLSAFTRLSLELQADGTRVVESLQEIHQDATLTKLESALATGTGVGEPQGLITGLAAVAASVVAPTTAEAYGRYDPIKLQNALGARWSRNASFLAALKIINETAIFQVGTDGSLLYPNVQNGQILNRSIREWSNMDSAYDATATVAHNYLLAYGSWKDAYLVATRLGMSMEVIPHLFNSSGNPTGERGCWTYGRFGAGVILPEAGLLLDVPTTA